ncbi:16S rRNA (cytosine(967)-C(5))-methyltransferase RsmB [Dongshaea marina]|uniref:16S rRNA (cytosine(967)-C(5))-methyltransferase RsmB n=1 Tax=Dongshaea marina TaxID=2047966 RepID=UPI000D3E2550|nr:16S rRNA (cytosine(967)-C(5))-methyltransferase RsmB [Dongshaea marina]
MKTRAEAARVIHSVIHQGQSLSNALPRAQAKVGARNRALLQELCFGTLRWYGRLDAIAAQLLKKPLKGKQRILHSLILVGLYQLLYTRVPDHAAVTETVNASKLVNFATLRGLVNGVLRNFMRNRDELCESTDQNPNARLSHPQWLSNRIRQAYPEQWQDILEANNQKPPMWIRVNTAKVSRSDWLEQLTEQQLEGESSELASSAVQLAQATDVEKLPGFSEGRCSVQDAAAQMAALLLEAAPGELILDACAAPGGKTIHILESQPQLKQMVAVDSEADRLERLQENLGRSCYQAKVLQGDASKPQQWWQGEAFDRILLDAPCSATGVIRRHPDIRWLRRDTDIDELVKLQASILDAMWQQLKPGGTLLYATCSILPQENSLQIELFLERTDDARLCPLPQQSDPKAIGWQILPGEQGMDGFYYAKLQKMEA